MENSYADMQHLVSKELFTEKFDALIAAAGSGTTVVANPTLAGTEAALTGLEVGKTKYKVGDGLPEVNSGDAGKFLSVSGNGQWNLSDNALRLQVKDEGNNDHIKYGLEAGEINDFYDFQTSPVLYMLIEPVSLGTKIQTALNSIISGLMTDYKYHKATFTVDSSDPNYDEINTYYKQFISHVPAVKIYSSMFLGDGVYAKAPYNQGVAPCLSSYGVMQGVGLGAFVLFMYAVDSTTLGFDLYAKREEVAT